jgi:hypothetical protein
MLKEYQGRVNELFMQELGHTTLNFKWNTPAEAEEHIKNIDFLQQELRGLKRELRARIDKSTMHTAVTGIGSPVRDIDGVIMQLAMTKLHIGKNRHGVAS